MKVKWITKSTLHLCIKHGKPAWRSHKKVLKRSLCQRHHIDGQFLWAPPVPKWGKTNLSIYCLHAVQFCWDTTQEKKSLERTSRALQDSHMRISYSEGYTMSGKLSFYVNRQCGLITHDGRTRKSGQLLLSCFSTVLIKRVKENWVLP